MKNQLIIIAFLSLYASSNLPGQNSTPQGINYQCIVRDATGMPSVDLPVTVYFEILDQTVGGVAVYGEEHSTMTNSFGLVNLIIGQGSSPSGDFSAIDWGSGPKFLKVSIEDMSGVVDELGTTQLLSVPYALFAEKSSPLVTDNTLQGDGSLIAPLVLSPQGADEGNVLKWINGVWTPSLDLDTDNQMLSLDSSGTELSLSNGSVVQLNQYLTSPGSGIEIQGNPPNLFLSNTGDKDPDDDLTIASLANGDITGVFQDLQINPGVVGTEELANNSVSSDKLQSGSVLFSKLENGDQAGQLLKWDGNAWALEQDISSNAILNGDIAGGSLSGFYPSPQVAPGAISTQEILDGTITLQDLEPGLIPITLPPSGSADGDLTGMYPAPEIKPGVVGTEELANNSVSSDKLQNGSVLFSKLENGDQAGQLVKWDGNNWVLEQDIGSNAVLNGDIAGGSLTGSYPSPQVAPEAISTLEILDSTITLEDLAPGLIPSALPPSGSAGGSLTGSYPSPQVAPGAISTQEILDSTITLEDLSPGVLPTTLPPSGSADGDLTGMYPAPEIKPGAVGNEEIADGAVSANKLDQMGASNGQILKWNNDSWVPGNDQGGSFAAGTGIEIDADTINAQSTNAIWNASHLQGIEVKPSTPSQGWVLKYLGTKWIPQPDNYGSFQSNCGQILTTESVSISVDNNACPDTDYNLTITGQSKDGLLIDINKPFGDVLGARIEATGGSNSNDGVILLSRSSDNASNALKVAAESDNPGTSDVMGMYMVAGDDAFGTDGNNTPQNYGVYIDLKDNASNNQAASSRRDIGLYIKTQNKTHDWAIYTSGDIATEDDIYCDNVYSASDIKLKENIKPIGNLLSDIQTLNPVSYNYIHDTEKKEVFGLIAQNVESVFPELTSSLIDDNDQKISLINYSNLSVVAIKAIQEQQEIIESQQATIDSQEARIDKLEKEMAEIRAMLKAQTSAQEKRN